MFIGCAAIHHIVLELYKRGYTSLVFLPGKGAIEDAHKWLVKEGLCETWIADLHADLDPSEMRRVLVPYNCSKVIL